MEMSGHLRRFFRYDNWANREVIAALKNSTPVPPRSLKLLAHLLGTQYEWYSRIRKEQSLLAIWPDLTLGQCEEHTGNLQTLWSHYLDEIGPQGLSAPITYKNTEGQFWTNALQDILLHVIFHSTYHRGQIATDMRAAGFTPAYTDFIHGARLNLID